MERWSARKAIGRWVIHAPVKHAMSGLWSKCLFWAALRGRR